MSRSLRESSPEFCNDYEHYRARRGNLRAKPQRPDMPEIVNAGSDAAWRAYPARPENPHRPGSDESAAWQSGADSCWLWAQMHEQEGWYRVIDGAVVQPSYAPRAGGAA